MLGKQFPIDEQATLITGIRPKNHKRRKRRRVAKHNSNNRNNINDNLARIKARGSASNAALRAGGSVLQRALQSSRSTSALTHQQPDYHTSGAATATTTAIAATAATPTATTTATATTAAAAVVQEQEQNPLDQNTGGRNDEVVDNITTNNNDDDNDDNDDSDDYGDEFEDDEFEDDFEDDQDTLPALSTKTTPQTSPKASLTLAQPRINSTKPAKRTKPTKRGKKPTKKIYNRPTSNPYSMSMSSMPSAPLVSSFYAQLGGTSSRKDGHRSSSNTNPLKTSNTKSNTKSRTSTTSKVVENESTPHPSTYININPKDKASPFAPNKHRRIVTKATTRVRRTAAIESGVDERDVTNGVEQLNTRMSGFGSEAAALDEFNSLLGKRLYMFGGFGVKREKPGAGKRGWRNIWDATSILTQQRTVPREDIERAEGCSYYYSDTYMMTLERRPRWKQLSTRHSKRERTLLSDVSLNAPSVAPTQGGAHSPPPPSAMTGHHPHHHYQRQIELAPLGRSDHTMTLVRGSYAFAFGGKQRGHMHGGDCNPLNDVCVLDLHASGGNVWRTASVSGKVISCRWSHATVWSENAGGGMLFVVGGIAAASPFGRFDPYLDVSHNKSVPVRHPTGGHSQKKKKATELSEARGGNGNEMTSFAMPTDAELLANLSPELRDAMAMDEDLSSIQAPSIRNIRSVSSPNGNDPDEGTNNKPAKQNSAPCLIGALNTSTMSWHVPSIVTPDEEGNQNGGPSIQYISQARPEIPPYSMCGHSMDQNQAWQNNNGAHQQCDMFIYGGWEWKNIKGKVEGPSLSQSLRILRTKDASTAYTAKMTWGRLEISNHDQLGPGPRANHSSAAHSVGLLIFGGRCLDTNNKNAPPPSKNMMRHGSNTSVQLKYLNDLCILQRIPNGSEFEDENKTIEKADNIENNRTIETDTTDAIDTAGDGQWLYRWAKVEITGSPPRPRENAQMININDGSLLLHGGYSGESGHCPPIDEYVEGLPPGTIDHPWLNDLYVLRIVQNNGARIQVAWTQILTGSKSPSPRCGHGLLLADVANTDPSKCIFGGAGLKECVVGGQTFFEITTHDKNGNPRWSGRDTFQITIEGPWSTKHVYKVDEDPEMNEEEEEDISLRPSTGGKIPQPTEKLFALMEDLSNGKYYAHYTAMVSGHYTIEVMCNGKHVNEAPFSMWAQAGPATPTNSRVTEIDGDTLDLDSDPPQFTLTAGERATLGVTTRDHFGNIRKRGGEAWRLKTHVLSLQEDIDGGSINMLKWRHATPSTTRELANVAREIYVNAVRQAATDICNCIVIDDNGIKLQWHSSSNSNNNNTESNISFKSYTGKKARATLKDYVSRQIHTHVPDEATQTSAPTTTTRGEEVVHRVTQNGKLMGGEYYVLSSTMKLTLVTTEEEVGNNGASNDFFQHWSLLFHAVNPEGGSEHALLIEDVAALDLLQRLNSGALAGFREYSFDEGTHQQEQYTCVVDAPAVVGPALVAVTMDGRHIIGSPFKCNLRPSVPSSKHTVVTYGSKDTNPDNPDVTNNTAVQQLSTSTTVPIPLVITAYDKNGLARDIGGQWYSASARRMDTNMEEGQTKQFVVADHGDGTYSCSMSFPTVGLWKIEVLCFMFPPELRGNDGGGNSAEQCKKGNAVEVVVHSSKVCASRCIVDGLQSARVAWSLSTSGKATVVADTKIAPHRVVAGNEIVLNLTARDAFGNIVREKCNFSMRLVRQGGHEVLGCVEQIPRSNNDNGNNGDMPTHRCRATLYESALYELQITEGFDLLPSMPTAILIEPHRPQPLSCVITPSINNMHTTIQVKRHLAINDIAELYLIAKDKYGNVCDLTIDDMSAHIVWPHESVAPNALSDGKDKCEVQPLGDGIYKCQYGSTRAGKFALHLLHEGTHVLGSPVYVNVTPGDTDVKSYNCKGGALDLNKPVMAGSNVHFTIFARDCHHNRVNQSDIALHVSGKVKTWSLDPWKDLERRKKEHHAQWDENLNNQKTRRDQRKLQRIQRLKQQEEIKAAGKEYATSMKQMQHARQQKKLYTYSASVLIDDVCQALEAAHKKSTVAAKTRKRSMDEYKSWERKKSSAAVAKEPFTTPPPTIPPVHSISNFAPGCYTSLSGMSANASSKAAMLNDTKDMKSDAVEFRRQFANNFGIQLDSEVSDDSDDDIGDYEEPKEFSEPITEVINCTVKNNQEDGTYPVTIELAKYVFGEIEITIKDATNHIHIQGSPFTLHSSRFVSEYHASNFQIVPNPNFDRYAGVPMKIRVRKLLKEPTKTISNHIKEHIQCWLIPLPDAGTNTKQHTTSNSPSQKSTEMLNDENKKMFEDQAPPADGCAILAEPFEIDLEPILTSTLDFSHTLIGACKYRVIVTLYGEEVEGSPFDVNIRGSKAGARRCVMFGNGHSFATVGQETEFFVCVCDQYGNLRMTGEDNIIVSTTGNSKPTDIMSLNVVAQSPGMYRCQYTAKKSGMIHFSVTCNGDKISGAPFQVRVDPGPISAEKTTAIITVSKQIALSSTSSALPLFEEVDNNSIASNNNGSNINTINTTSSNTGIVLRVPSGAPLRLILHTRDIHGNLRQGKHSTVDAEQLVVQWKRSDDGTDVYTNALKPKLLPVTGSQSTGGTLQCIFQLLKEGVYTIFITAAEYTSTRLGKYGCIKNVTENALTIRVSPSKCHGPSCMVFPIDDEGRDERPDGTFSWDMETSAAYSRFTRKKLMEIAMSGSTESMKKWCYGPYSRSRRSLDAMYHGIYSRARQEMQDEIVRGTLNKGATTPQPYFILLTGVMGAGKRHTMSWLDRAGRFPMNAFVWVDPYQLSLQLPECLELLKDPNSPPTNHRVMEATCREAGSLAELLVAEALFRKKSVLFSTATNDVEWWQKWIEGIHSLHPEYRFGIIHIEAGSEDVVDRRKTLHKSYPFHPLKDLEATKKEIKQSTTNFEVMSKLELWEYTAVISNPSNVVKKKVSPKDGEGNNKSALDTQGNGAASPELISESGGHAWSTAPAPSEVPPKIDYSDLELEAIAWRDQLSQVWVDNALVMPRARLPKELQDPSFAKLVHQWRLFCLQWETLFNVAPLHQMTEGITLTEHSSWNSRPRLYLTAGQTANVRVHSFDIHMNPVVSAEAADIKMDIAATSHSHSGNTAPSMAVLKASSHEIASPPELTCTSTYSDNGDGSYICTYGSTKMGVYQLMIGNISGEQVPGSPFWLHVVSGEMDANHCSAQGPALQSIFYGSDNAVFNIETFDSYNNPVGVGGHEFDVHVLGSDTTSAAHMDRGNNNAATSKSTTTLATGSKKAALRDALNHAARLEGEMELLSSSHEAVLRGEATTGNVSDFGNGTYGVQFNPCDVPQWLQKHHKSLVILVVDAVSGEHIGGSPFIVPCIQSPVHASQCTLELHHVHDVVAGNVYSAMIHLPDHHHTSHNTPLPFALPLFPSITIRPIWSGETNTIPVQSSRVYSTSNTLIRSLFSVKSTSLDPLTYEVAFGGGLVCASGGRSNHLPIIDAATAVPSKCVVKERNHFGGLQIAAAGRTNTFEIQARDRFNIDLNNNNHCGECRARVMGSLGKSIVCRSSSSTASNDNHGADRGTWLFEYDVPMELGFFGHSGDEPCILSIAVELWDEQRNEWSHIGKSPFSVPVYVMLGESLQFADFLSGQSISDARLQLWTGHQGSGTRVAVGCAGKDGIFAVGDLRNFSSGLYTIEVEAKGYFSKRFGTFIPKHGTQKSMVAPKIMKKKKNSRTSHVSGDPSSLGPPEYSPVSTNKELPRLRVLKQGDIDLSDDMMPELKHLWWFAKKDNVVAASMKSSGELIELDLDQCVTLFGDDPDATGEHEFVPTAYKKYLEARSVYNKQVGDLLKTNHENDGGSNEGMGVSVENKVRWFNVETIQLVRNNIQTFMPQTDSSMIHTTTPRSSSNISAEIVQKMKQRSELLILLTWNKTVTLNTAAPALLIEFAGTAATTNSDPAQRQTLSHSYALTEGAQQLKKEGLFSSWERNDNNCTELLCLRDVPTLDFSIRVAPRYAIHTPDTHQTNNEEEESGYNHLAELSMSAATVQIYQRTGHIGTFAAYQALESFQPETSRILSRVEWSVLTSGTTASSLLVDDCIQATYRKRWKEESLDREEQEERGGRGEMEDIEDTEDTEEREEREEMKEKKTSETIEETKKTDNGNGNNNNDSDSEYDDEDYDFEE